jgi:glutamate synthase (NADPH/NADH) small chain
MPEPPAKENKLLTWPHWPMKLRTSSSQEEGADREFAIITKELIGEDGKVTALVCERNGERVELKADLVLLAMGFLGPCIPGAVEQSGVSLTDRGNVDAAFGDFRTSNPRIFACGDMRRGQSLVVWAIREGRDCARSVHAQLSAATRQAA